jgi:hypothetical protein
MSNRKRELLEAANWEAGRPQILTVSEAFAQHADNRLLYMVAWWGDIPAGFSRFEFTGYISGGYEIRYFSEGKECMDALEDDELVLLFEPEE